VERGTPSADDPEYAALARFRFLIRRFLHFSDQAARVAGLEPQQHQLLLAIKGLAHGHAASIGQLADWLLVRHHSAVELVDRAAGRGLVERAPDPADRRRMLVRLTPAGEDVLRRLSLEHRVELRSAAPALLASLSSLLAEAGADRPAPPAERPAEATASRDASTRRLRRPISRARRHDDHPPVTRPGSGS